jgi:nicotinate-nucleotide adenylyltransferase
MTVGLFFGSFNPIHVGHLIIANTMATQTDLEQVWFVVSPLNPFKKSQNLLHEFDRIDLVEMAIQGNARLRATDIEFSMPRPSYTIDTLLRLTEKFPQHRFRLIIGADNLLQFPNWKSHDAILNQFGLYVYPRPNRIGEPTDPGPLIHHPAVQIVDAPLLDISATFVRDSIRQNHSIRYLVPDAVEEMIGRKKFYT